MTYIRFAVDNRERLWTLSMLTAERISLHDYICLLMTHLCVPQPRAAELIPLVRTPMDPKYAVDPDLGEVALAWPDALVVELAPALEAAGLDLPSLLSTLWVWAQCPDGEFSPALKARLDAFAKYFLDIDIPYSEGSHADVGAFPWNDRKYKEPDNDQ